MENEELCKTVKRARGKRTFREYARDSGVDSSTISKIEKGTYIPKDPTIFYKLASPENNVTVDELIKAANYSRDFRAGMKLGAMGYFTATALMANPLLGAMAASTAMGELVKDSHDRINEKNRQEELDLLRKKVQQYVAIANGILYGKLAEKGIIFKQNPVDESNIAKRILTLSNGLFETYLVLYLYVDDSERDKEIIFKNSVKKAYENLIFLEPLKKYKVSYLVNDKKLYKFMCEYKDKLSFAGNLSVIYIDQATAEFVSEECICRLGDIEETDVINMI